MKNIFGGYYDCFKRLLVVFIFATIIAAVFGGFDYAKHGLFGIFLLGICFLAAVVSRRSEVKQENIS